MKTTATYKTKVDWTNNKLEQKHYENVFEIGIDAVSPDVIIEEAKGSVMELLHALVEHSVRYDLHTAQEAVECTIECMVFGMGYELKQKITQEVIDEVKKGVKPEPELNRESLQNDLQQMVPMIQSFTHGLPADSNWDDLRWQIEQIERWVHHMLEKHFQIPMPKELVPKTAQQQLEEINKQGAEVNRLLDQNKEKAKAN
jgi:hypothetical protein